jgi:hypothetical protein
LASIRSSRYAGAAGIVFVAMLIAASIASPFVPGDQSAGTLVSKITATRAGTLVGVDLQFAGVIVFFVYLAGVYQIMRRSDDRSWLAPATLVTGITTGATVVLAQSVLGTLAAYVVGSATAETVRAMYAVYAGMYQGSDIFLVLFLLSGAAASVGAGVYPRWIGFVALVSSVLILVGAFSYAVPSSPLSLVDLLGILLFLVFMLGSSVVLIRGRAAPALARESTAA